MLASYIVHEGSPSEETASSFHYLKLGQGEGTDPGMLLRGQTKSDLQKKFGAVLDSSKSLADVKSSLDS